MDAICKFCQLPFTYERGPKRERLRVVCDPCRESRRHWLRKRVRRTGNRKKRHLHARRLVVRRMHISAKDFEKEKERLKLEPGDFLPRDILAEKLGVSEAEVIRIEGEALKKLRGSTLLQEAYGKFIQGGKPLLDTLWEALSELMRERDEARVMAMQQELVRWWQRHDAWSVVGRKDPVARAAALEIKAEIEKCRTALLRELGKIPFVEV